MMDTIILLTLVYFSNGSSEPKMLIEPTTSMYVCNTWKRESIQLANDNSSVDLVSAKCEEH